MRVAVKLQPSIQLCGSFGSKFCYFALIVAGIFLSPPKYRGIGTLSSLFHRFKIGGQQDIVLSLWQDRKIAIGTADYYWSRLIFSDFEYEPEIEFVLCHMLTPDTIFLDLGANIGYWSIFCSSIITDDKNIVAVEAGPESFKRLKNNRDINRSSFSILNFAVSETSHKIVHFASESKHAASQIITNEEVLDKTIVQIETISIDDILRKSTSYDGVGAVIVKLDIEGAEIAAMKGAQNLLQNRNYLIVYEDHGNDANSRASHFFLMQPEVCVFYVDNGHVEQITTLKMVHSKKVETNAGYNFFACHRDSKFFEKFDDLRSTKL